MRIKRKGVNTHDGDGRARNRASDHAMGFHLPYDRVVYGRVLPVGFRKVMLNGAGSALKQTNETFKNIERGQHEKAARMDF